MGWIGYTLALEAQMRRAKVVKQDGLLHEVRGSIVDDTARPTAPDSVYSWGDLIQ